MRRLRYFAPLDRGTDIDDLLLNTLGAVLGYLLFLLIRRLWPALVEKCRVRAVE
ncbi:MAG: VanZ family protein [Clostridiales bacterium]|nr:VanZ family protein [Clostridiales bacterium]